MRFNKNKFIKDLVDLADSGNTSVEEVIADIVQRDYEKILQSIDRKTMRYTILDDVDAPNTLELVSNE